MDIGDLETASAGFDDGVWVDDVVHGLKGVRLLVRPATSPIVSREMGRALRNAPNEDLDADGVVSQQAQDRIEDDVTSRVGLIGWDGLTSKGKRFPFNEKNARRMLSVSVFWSAVRTSTMHATVSSQKALEELAKN